MIDNNIRKAAEYIREATAMVAFTGAGVSTESNIPDFRSDRGLYTGEKEYPYPPEIMLSHSFFIEHTDIFFQYYRSKMIYKDAKPNPCHLSLAKLEEMGKLKAVITQNIDGLHSLAGSKNVLELHGTVYSNTCMKCGKKFGLEKILSTEAVPLCDQCGGIVKPDVVLYEEPLNEELLERSVDLIASADVLLVAGTSLVVNPAASLLRFYRGNKLILINKSPTPYDYRANVIIRQPVGQVMGEIMDQIS